MTIEALLRVIYRTEVLEDMSQMSSLALVSMVPAQSSFLSLLRVMHEISGASDEISNLTNSYLYPLNFF